MNFYGRGQRKIMMHQRQNVRKCITRYKFPGEDGASYFKTTKTYQKILQTIQLGAQQ